MAASSTACSARAVRSCPCEPGLQMNAPGWCAFMLGARIHKAGRLLQLDGVGGQQNSIGKGCLQGSRCWLQVGSLQALAPPQLASAALAAACAPAHKSKICSNMSRLRQLVCLRL